MQPSRQHGFNIIELMITVFVMAILAAIAVPNFRNVIQRGDVSAASNALLADLAYARGEAVTRGTVVSICPSTDGQSCVDSSAAYGSGWIVYTYTAGKAVANTKYSSVASDGNLLLRYTTARPNASVTASSTSVLSVGQQGQLLPAGTTLTFTTCFQQNASSTPVNTMAVPGAVLNVSATGSVVNKSLASGGSCT